MNNNNSTVIVTFFTKPWMVSPLPFDPYLAMAITTPNGTTYTDQIHVSTDQFLAAHDQANVTIGENWVRGDLKTYELHTEPDKGFGADLVFTCEGPSMRGGGKEEERREIERKIYSGRYLYYFEYFT
jgi:hypothetical protein